MRAVAIVLVDLMFKHTMGELSTQTSKSSSQGSRRIRIDEGNQTQASLLWQDKYTPKGVKDLAVHHTKVTYI